MARGHAVKKFLFDFEDFNRATLCSIAAAVLGAGALGAGASIYGATKAADAQVDSTNAALAQERSIYGQNQNLLQPFIQAGASNIPALNSWLDPNNPNNPLSSLINFTNPNATSGPLSSLINFTNPNNASSPLAALLGLTTPGANMDATLQQTPGYQFSEDQGLRAVNNQLASRGLGGSPGAVAKGAANFTTGLASNTWQNVVNALQGVFTSGTGALQNTYASGANALQSLFTGGANALQGAVNTGAQAGGALAGNASGIGNSISNLTTGQGNALAGMYTSIGNSVSNLGSSVSTAAILQKLLGGTGTGGGAGIYSLPQSGNYSGVGQWSGPQFSNAA